jgi:hypothetical protein
MNIAREYEVERVASKDTSRTYLCHCYLDVEKQRLVATDGHAMAVVPVSGLTESPGDCPKDESGFVSVDALKAARKGTSKRQDHVVMSANGKHVLQNGTTMPRPVVINGMSFPPYEQVLPEYRKGSPDTITIGFSPELLVQLMKAIGQEKMVALTFPVPSRVDQGSRRIDADIGHQEVLDPFVVEGKDGAVGVLMPCRI